MKRICMMLVIVVLALTPLAPVEASVIYSKNSKEMTDRVIVKVSQSKLLNRVLQYGSTMLEKKANLMSVQKPKNISMTSFLKELRKQPGILYAEPDYKIALEALPNDPSFKKQWHHEKIHTAGAWKITKGSEQTIVAVIDNGIDMKHPDLSPNIVKPFDVVANTNKKMPVGEHGTHVAGLIAAVANNQIGGTGVAPGAKIMPINVFTKDEAYTSDIIKGIQYAEKSGADIINMSLGMYDYSKALNDAVQAADKKGVLIVGAAGNDRKFKESFYPAAFPNVLSVSSTTKYDAKSYFSNYGSTIDIAAPGSEIISTLPKGQYGSMSGTSMAAPIVSGSAALVLSKEPRLTNEQVAYRLMSTADDLGPKGKDTSFGAGRVNVANALKHRLLVTPIVSQLTDKDKSIRIQYKAAFNGKIIITGKTRIEKQLNVSAVNEIIAIPQQKGDSIVTIKLVDKDGNESWPVKRKVKDTTPPAAPKVNEIKDNNKSVTGKAEAGTKITVKKGKTLMASGIVNSAGSFSLSMKSIQKPGTALIVQATDKSGNASSPVKALVKDKTAPKLININKFTISSTKVKGTTEPNAKVVVKVSNKEIGKGKADKSGIFSVSVKKQKLNTTMRVYLTDGAGNTGSYRLTVRK